MSFDAISFTIASITKSTIYMNKKKILIVIIVLMAVLGGAALAMRSGTSGSSKLAEIPADWERLEGDGLSFAYPTEFGTSFISPKVWPPLGYILSASGALPCAEGDTQEGAMTYRKIEGNEYCITEASTDTNGVIETQYAYTFKSDEKVVAFILSLRYLACEKMAPERKTACETERTGFKLDEIVNKIASTFTVSKIEEAPENLVAPEGA